MADMYRSEAASQRPAVNAGRLWAGGLATALVAALIAVVGILAARGLFGVPMLAQHARALIRAVLLDQHVGPDGTVAAQPDQHLGEALEGERVGLLGR